MHLIFCFPLYLFCKLGVLEEYAEAMLFLQFLKDGSVLSMSALTPINANEYLGGLLDFTGEVFSTFLILILNTSCIFERWFGIFERWFGLENECALTPIIANTYLGGLLDFTGEVFCTINSSLLHINVFM